MRKTILLLAVIGLAGSLWAADPSVGTWKLNVAKSKYPPTEQAPKEQMLVKREMGADQFELSITGVNADGSPLSLKMTHAQRGGLVSGLPEGSMAVLVLVAPGETFTTFLQDGKQAQLHHNIVSKDGKTMTQTIKAINDKGQSVDVIEVWNKQ
jgi:hypothetical protein